MLPDKTKAKLRELYTDPEKGLTSKKNFIKNARDAGILASNKDIGTYYDSLASNQIFARPSKNTYTKIQCQWGRGCLHADLMDVSKFSTHNNGVTFLLNVIEVETKYIWSFPLKSKKPKEVAQHLETVYNDFHEQEPRHFISLRTDDGNEFKGAVNTLNKKMGVKHERTTNKNAMGMIESLHKSFWDFFRRWSAVNNNNFNFVSVLPSFVKNYNNREHSTTKEKPITLFTGKKPIPYTKKQPDLKYKVGDRVRIKRKKDQFEKASFLPTLSDQVYELVESNGRRWTIKNINNNNELKTTYLERELVKVKGSPEQISVEPAIRQRNKEATTRRRNKQEKAFQLDEGERRRLQPRQSKRSAKKPERYRGSGISDGILFLV